MQQISVNEIKHRRTESMDPGKSMENILQGVVVCSTGLTSLQKVGGEELVEVSAVRFWVPTRVSGRRVFLPTPVFLKLTKCHILLDGVIHSSAQDP